MGHVVLYIAASLDGYIADANGGIDWLTAFDRPDEDFGYAAFLQRIGAIIVGGKTYRQVLRHARWPYAGIPCYVVTRHALADVPDAGISAFSGDVARLVEQTRRKTSKDIWLIGGAELVTQFANAGLIDEYIISIMPLTLGSGIALFQGITWQQRLTLVEAKTYPASVVQVTYTRTREMSETSGV
jgi:dihydrofolate reductase